MKIADILLSKTAPTVERNPKKRKRKGQMSRRTTIEEIEDVDSPRKISERLKHSTNHVIEGPAPAAPPAGSKGNKVCFLNIAVATSNVTSVFAA